MVGWRRAKAHGEEQVSIEWRVGEKRVRRCENDRGREKRTPIPASKRPVTESC